MENLMENIILLKSLSDNDVNAIIISETTSGDDIQKIIDEVKSENEEWQCDDILNRLPDDCEVYVTWGCTETVYW
jgi:hypothetical protein